MRYAVRKRNDRWVVSSGTQCGLEFDEFREALAVAWAALVVLQQAHGDEREAGLSPLNEKNLSSYPPR